MYFLYYHFSVGCKVDHVFSLAKPNIRSNLGCSTKIHESVILNTLGQGIFIRRLNPCIPTNAEPSNRLLFGFHSIIAVSGPPIIESLWFELALTFNELSSTYLSRHLVVG